MVRNDLESMLGESMEIKVFSPSTCPCENDCQQVEISAKDWNGNLDERGLSLKSIWGSTVEIGDAVISEGRALWNNPGEFLMTRVFGQSTKNSPQKEAIHSLNMTTTSHLPQDLDFVKKLPIKRYCFAD